MINKNTDYISRSHQILAWNESKEAKKIISEACKRAKKTLDGKGIKNHELKLNISMYARENDSECLAEGLADYYANGEKSQILSKKIYEILKELLK